MKKINWSRVIFITLFVIISVVTIFFQYIYVGSNPLDLNPIGVFGIFAFFVIIDAIIVLFVIRIYKQAANHQKVFSCFKSREVNYDDLDVLYNAIQKMPYEQEIIKEDNTVTINNMAGKFTVKYIKGKGLLKGGIRDKKWVIGNTIFDNPFSIEENNFILKYPTILYNVYGVQICDVGQIVFKIEKELLNVKSKK